jgi:hypothetical protein
MTEPIDPRAEMDWMQTFSGRAFYPLDPRPEDIDINDIAIGLARECRFSGQCRAYYTVAEHSVLVSYDIEERYALEGLLHDAAEAYLRDLTAPVKRALRVIESGRGGSATGRSSYDQLEDAVCRAISARFGLLYPFPDAVKVSDQRVLLAEYRDALDPPPRPRKEMGAPSSCRVLGLNPQAARQNFLDRFADIMKQRSPS